MATKADRSKTSPYFRTPLVGDYRDLLNLPDIPQSENDEYYTVENKFDRSGGRHSPRW